MRVRTGRLETLQSWSSGQSQPVEPGQGQYVVEQPRAVAPPAPAVGRHLAHHLGIGAKRAQFAINRLAAFPLLELDGARDKVSPFFVFPPAVRKVVYTTNAIESINARPRKNIKTRGHFPRDEAASKLIWLDWSASTILASVLPCTVARVIVANGWTLIWLALRNITANWGSPATK